MFGCLFPLFPLLFHLWLSLFFSSCRFHLGMATDRVWVRLTENPIRKKNIAGLNLTPEPTGEIWHPTHRVLGQVRVPVGFYKLISFRFFGFLSGFGCTRGWVKNETCTQTRFCAGRFWVRVTGVKMHLNPHPRVQNPRVT
jgi:hypothetical protein